MSRFEPVAPEHASRLLNHGPTVLVTTAFAGQRNLMAAAWSMPVEFTPPRIAIVIDKSTLTKELINASGQFAIVIPSAEFATQTYAAGSISRRDGDKFDRLQLHVQQGPVLGLPVLEDGCIAWMECRLIPESHTEQAYDTCFAEVISAAADPRAFSNGHWHMDVSDPATHTIHHLGGGLFMSLGGQITTQSPF